jgi:hypothetical protein
MVLIVHNGRISHVRDDVNIAAASAALGHG